jgi:hypothetical protein
VFDEHISKTLESLSGVHQKLNELKMKTRVNIKLTKIIQRIRKVYEFVEVLFLLIIILV